MTTASRDQAAARLEAERRRTTQRLERLRQDHEGFVAASLNSNADDEHDPEGATIAFERSQVETLSRRLQQHLADIEAAERRVEDGTYGICERCGAAIPDARLEARPTARTCVACAA
ncbi:TraR/DksA family transcriptional regulator [Nocardioides halotolerans]|uniref:TraR/DksA family transcriptional regulator n=1 Tax=Nocardioides halotolerans TaxID=433660 RepID=UPI00040E01B1|nr:TraR/DksA C4-type zinc finger protein [Nocardioides halotolerans]